MENVTVQKQEDSSSLLARLERRIQQVRDRAYEIFHRRGGETGQDLEDWLIAEREIDGDYRTELIEKDEASELRMELPGFSLDQVTVTALPRAVCVEALAQQSVEETVESQTWSGYATREVYRCIDLLKEANIEQVTAVLADGVLTVHVPYKECGQPDSEEAQDSASRVTVAAA